MSYGYFHSKTHYHIIYVNRITFTDSVSSSECIRGNKCNSLIMTSTAHYIMNKVGSTQLLKAFIMNGITCVRAIGKVIFFFL